MTVANARNTDLPNELADSKISLLIKRTFTGTLNQYEQNNCKDLVNITKYSVCHSVYANVNDKNI